MQMLYNPFKIIYGNDTIAAIQFKATDTLWSRNFKRAIASTFQLKNVKSGAFVENEVKMHSFEKYSTFIISNAVFFLLLLIFGIVLGCYFSLEFTVIVLQSIM